MDQSARTVLSTLRTPFIILTVFCLKGGGCLSLHRDMAESDSTTLTDIPASSDSIINESSGADSNDYAEDSLSTSSSFSLNLNMFEPIGSDSSNSNR